MQAQVHFKRARSFEGIVRFGELTPPLVMEEILPLGHVYIGFLLQGIHNWKLLLICAHNSWIREVGLKLGCNFNNSRLTEICSVITVDYSMDTTPPTTGLRSAATWHSHLSKSHWAEGGNWMNDPAQAIGHWVGKAGYFPKGFLSESPQVWRMSNDIPFSLYWTL